MLVVLASPGQLWKKIMVLKTSKYRSSQLVRTLKRRLDQYSLVFINLYIVFPWKLFFSESLKCRKFKLVAAIIFPSCNENFEYFPHKVGETLQGSKVFKVGNYSRKYLQYPQMQLHTSTPASSDLVSTPVLIISKLEQNSLDLKYTSIFTKN